MRQKCLVVSIVAAAGCSSAPSTVEVPHAEITLGEPVAPSAVARLGVEESVSGMGAAGERTVRSVTERLAGCLKPVLEREPSLKGQVRFDLEVGTSVVARRVAGGLKLPAAACIESALAEASSPRGQSGKVSYALSFMGAYDAAPLRPDVDVFAHWAGRDWSTPSGELPAALSKTQEALRDPIRRCAFGAAPEMTERLWLVLRVMKGGSVMLGPSGTGEAADCVRRVIGGASFPDAGHDYALSVVLQPESAVVPPAEEASGDGQSFGMIGLFGPTADDAPKAPWADEGDAPKPPWADGGAKHNVWGDEIGDAFGAGGLGLSGTLPGGGGTGTGTIGIGTGSGFGSGSGKLGGSRKTKLPVIKMGSTTSSPGLPKELVQRIVRMHIGRFRLCYEKALLKNPKLAGRVTVKFDIDRAGSPANVTSTTDMPDKSVSTCVAKAFYGLSFPQPEGGVVKVTYPLSFKPSSDAPDPAPLQAAPAPEPPPPTIGGKLVSAITLLDLENRLLEKSFAVADVPGFEKGKSPLLFVRDEGWPTPFIVTVGPVASPEGWTCTAGKPEHMVRVHGEGCQRVLSPIMD